MTAQPRLILFDVDGTLVDSQADILAAMQAGFDKAGKTPPAALIQQTCGCVAMQFDATHNLEMAKTICTQQAQAGM